MTDSETRPPRSEADSEASRLGGAAALVGLAAVVVVWLIHPPQTISPQAGVGEDVSGEIATELPGFRPDGWFLPDDDLLGFVEIPAGSFLMGSDPAIDTLAFDNERWPGTRPQGIVDLPTFWIGRFEVTVAQFRAFVSATRRVVDAQALRGPPDHPVTGIAWTEALAYGRWLDRTLREAPETPFRLAELLRDGWRIDLPSEAEWEKAARGTEGWIYPWGNELTSSRANLEGRGTIPVGSFTCPRCSFGLSDMSGNVWELTRSPYVDYPYDAADRGDLGADALWVMRGGSFGDPVRNVRAAVRGGIDPGARRPFIGFRLALTRF